MTLVHAMVERDRLREVNGGPRRSLRQSVPTSVYVDSDFASIMRDDDSQGDGDMSSSVTLGSGSDTDDEFVAHSGSDMSDVSSTASSTVSIGEPVGAPVNPAGAAPEPEQEPEPKQERER